jgi:hypothetical protein
MNSRDELSILRLGETMFSLFSICLQIPLFLTLAMIPLMLLWMLSNLLLTQRITKQINFKVPTFMNVLAAKHAEPNLSQYIQCVLSSTSVITRLWAKQFDFSYSYFMQL